MLVPSSRSATPTATGVPTCPLATLPREARDTVRAIHANGPFPFPRNDGVVFGNREGHLPDQARGYYREYTVPTPGASNRSTRRIVTGGAPVTDPRELFYTADHYDSFCLVTDGGGRP
ncbi:ribonuclease domain-containing protein [Mycolicibacterium sp. P1-18]|uniref:ribonuclease domain-containing protein n=1 Tax=Mycolicibacterium sp. P1-18 TaxID=2024615 RepID=UPI001F5B0BB5|nr:ribonuclease domain-containing protein [Mycolicibacterium sp. P1-18]